MPMTAHLRTPIHHPFELLSQSSPAMPLESEQPAGPKPLPALAVSPPVSQAAGAVQYSPVSLPPSTMTVMPEILPTALMMPVTMASSPLFHSPLVTQHLKSVLSAAQ